MCEECNGTNQDPVKRPVARKEREIAINRFARDSHWEIEVGDPTFARELERKGYDHTSIINEGERAYYRIPVKAITIRSRRAVENPHQTRNLQTNGGASVGATQKRSKVGANTDPGPANDSEDMP